MGEKGHPTDDFGNFLGIDYQIDLLPMTESSLVSKGGSKSR